MPHLEVGKPTWRKWQFLRVDFVTSLPAELPPQTPHSLGTMSKSPDISQPTGKLSRNVDVQRDFISLILGPC